MGGGFGLMGGSGSGRNLTDSSAWEEAFGVPSVISLCM